MKRSKNKDIILNSIPLNSSTLGEEVLANFENGINITKDLFIFSIMDFCFMKINFLKIDLKKLKDAKLISAKI